MTTDFLSGRKSAESALTHDEELLLHLFRSLTPKQQEFYLELGNIFLRQNQKKESFHSGEGNKNAG